MPSEGKCTTKFFDWILPHPIIAAAGPLTSNLGAMSAVLRHGAAAVVTKTITPLPDRWEGGVHRRNNNLFNQHGFSRRSLAQWEADLAVLRGRPIIGSIYASTPEDLANLARKVVDTGTQVLELCLSCPTKEEDPVCCDPDRLEAFCGAVRAAVKVPILVKTVVQMSSRLNRDMARVIRRTGMDGMCISDALPAIAHASEGRGMRWKTGGLSGPFLKPLVLKALLDVSSSGLGIVAIGGIRNGRDVVECMQMGAMAVQVCSVLIDDGARSMARIVKEYQEIANSEMS